MGGIVDAVDGVLGMFGEGSKGKQNDAIRDAANSSTEAAKYAVDMQQKALDKQLELQAPWRKASESALDQLSKGVAPGGQFSTPFSQSNWQADPGYQFRLNEGIKSLNRQAAAQNGLISGAALKAAQNYGQNAASQEYQNAFNRYYQERSNMMNPLLSLSNLGQTSANNSGQAAQNYANNIGNISLTNGANQGNARLALGNNQASQYAGLGQNIDTLLNTNWGNEWDKAKGQVSKLFNGSGGGTDYGNSLLAELGL